MIPWHAAGRVSIERTYTVVQDSSSNSKTGVRSKQGLSVLTTSEYYHRRPRMSSHATGRERRVVDTREMADCFGGHIAGMIVERPDRAIVAPLRCVVLSQERSLQGPRTHLHARRNAIMRTPLTEYRRLETHVTLHCAGLSHCERLLDANDFVSSWYLESPTFLRTKPKISRDRHHPDSTMPSRLSCRELDPHSGSVLTLIRF